MPLSAPERAMSDHQPRGVLAASSGFAYGGTMMSSLQGLCHDGGRGCNQTAASGSNLDVGFINLLGPLASVSHTTDLHPPG